VNLIGGKNNIGKTALMEAVYINVHSTNINKMTTVIHAIKFMRENIDLLGVKRDPLQFDVVILNRTHRLKYSKR
jgi:AAA15 family ATPase/GTPase